MRALRKRLYLVGLAMGHAIKDNGWKGFIHQVNPRVSVELAPAAASSKCGRKGVRIGITST